MVSLTSVYIIYLQVLIRRSKRIPDEDAGQCTAGNLDTLVEPYKPAGEWSDVRVTLDSAIMIVNR